MSRGKKLTSEERKQNIIEAAAMVFAERGVDGARTRDIAAAAEINEALIYRHFTSKDELYRSAMMFSFDRAVIKWKEVANNQINGLEGLISIISEQLNMMAKMPALCANMWHGVACTIHDPIMREMVIKSFDDLHEFERSLVIRGQQDGSIKPVVLPDLAVFFIRGIIWVYIVENILKSPDTLNKLDTIQLIDYVRTRFGTAPTDNSVRLEQTQ